MRVIKTAAQFVYSIYAFLIFLVLMFLLLPFFVVGFALPHPSGGNAIFKIAWWWAKLFFIFTGIRYIPVYRARPEKGKCYIFVTNHISYLDIPMMILITRGFPVRILAKAEMASIPVFGWIYKKGAVCVKRDNAENRKKSVARLESLIKQKISVLLCPEGTFNMTNSPLKDFHSGAFRIAAELNEPLFPVVFPDTYDRLNYRSVFSMTPGKCRAVFLPPVYPDKAGNNDFEKLRDEVYQIMQNEIIDLHVNWVRKDK